jgi:hypothetical protein
MISTTRERRADVASLIIVIVYHFSLLVFLRHDSFIHHQIEYKCVLIKQCFLLLALVNFHLNRRQLLQRSMSFKS